MISLTAFYAKFKYWIFFAMALIAGIAQALTGVFQWKARIDNQNEVDPNRKEEVNTPDANNYKQPGGSWANSGDKADTPKGVETAQVTDISAKGNLKPDNGNPPAGERPTGDVIRDAENLKDGE
jgi:hypothetical protein